MECSLVWVTIWHVCRTPLDTGFNLGFLHCLRCSFVALGCDGNGSHGYDHAGDGLLPAVVTRDSTPPRDDLRAQLHKAPLPANRIAPLNSPSTGPEMHSAAASSPSAAAQNRSAWPFSL